MKTPAAIGSLNIAGECGIPGRDVRQREFSRQRLKLLIVDDDAELGALLRLILGKAGYRNVECITDPLAAVEFVQAWKPDLVVLDLLMPGVDGMKVLRELRTLVPDPPLLPILVVSGEHARETRQEAVEHGANDFLAKPYGIREMVATVGHLLETRRRCLLELSGHGRRRSAAGPQWGDRHLEDQGLPAGANSILGAPARALGRLG